MLERWTDKQKSNMFIEQVSRGLFDGAISAFRGPVTLGGRASLKRPCTVIKLLLFIRFQDVFEFPIAVLKP